MKVAVLQSSYIPWKGYFDLIHSSDLFIWYDDVQFTKNDWRNRNQIKTPNGLLWLSVPVGKEIHRNIDEVEIVEHKWQGKHLRSILQNYTKAPYIKIYKDWLEYVYLEKTWDSLSTLNIHIMTYIAEAFLKVKTEFQKSVDFVLRGGKGERLLDLLIQVKGKEPTLDYYCGPASKHYIDEGAFKGCGVNINYMTPQYPPYPQLFPPFTHNVSILDLLLNTGPDAPYYIWGWRERWPKS